MRTIIICCMHVVHLTCALLIKEHNVTQLMMVEVNEQIELPYNLVLNRVIDPSVPANK